MTDSGARAVHTLVRSQHTDRRIEHSAERGVEWLVNLQRQDGSLRGGSHIGAYYKVPFALASSGRIGECDRLLDYVRHEYLKGDGDLNGEGLHWFETFRIYPHSWLLIAAMMRGRFDLARPLLKFLISHFDRCTGGFFATSRGRVQGRGAQEIMTTSLAALACLWAGEVDIAMMTGQWLRQLYQSQPDLSRGLYHVRDSHAGLIIDFPKQSAVSYFVDATARQQWYFQYGISAAFLSALCAATQDDNWLQLAQDYLRASRHCREDVYSCPTSGKIGWGSAWTYRLSKDPEDRRRAEIVADGLIALQREDGSWGSASDDGDGGDVIDETAEFVGFQGEISRIVE